MGAHHHGPAKGITRWLFTTNHKDIGTMYLWFSFAMFILGGAFAMVIRAELFQPGMQLVEPGFFNQMTTLHGLVMVFGAIMPSFVGLANWLIPMMIGAPDMALPRMNNWSFWILPPGFLMLASTLFMEGGAPAFGWTFYAPLSTTYAPPSVTFFIFAIHVLGMSSIMGSINIIATVMNMRAPGMSYMKLPLFVWTWLITAFLLVAVMPVLAGAVTMMLMDIHFGTSFFSAAGGGDPVLFQHIFWFFGHPEVYIIILACVRSGVTDYSRVFPQTAVRVRLHGLRDGVHRFPVVYRLGPSYVYRRDAGCRRAVLYVRHHADCRTDRREGVQLDQHHVAGRPVL